MILYYRRNAEHGVRLEQAVTLDMWGDRPVVVHALAGLLDYVRSPGRTDKVLVLLVDSAEDLEQLDGQEGLLAELKKILVLPGEDNDCINQACTLYPSYITDVYSDFSDVRSVLEKLRARFGSL